MLFQRCSQLREPKLLRFFELSVEIQDLILLGSVDDVAELTCQFCLLVVLPENVNQLQNIRLDQLRIFLRLPAVVSCFKHLAVQGFHMYGVNAVGGFEFRLALCLRDKQPSDLWTEGLD